VDSLKALDPDRPIREADIVRCGAHLLFSLPARVVAMLEPNQVGDLAIRLREELQLGIDNTICQSATNTRWGWVAGVGVEQALTPNWSVKLEYEHLGLGNVTETLQPVCVGFCQAFQYNIRQTVDLIKVGVNYRFGGYGPLTAKY
jgi:opacity protein-like surface antigen